MEPLVSEYSVPLSTLFPKKATARAPRKTKRDQTDGTSVVNACACCPFIMKNELEIFSERARFERSGENGTSTEFIYSRNKQRKTKLRI